MSYTLTTTANPAEGGSVSPSTQEYSDGASVTISATPGEEYLFDHWLGAASGSSPTTLVVMDADKTLVANFIKKKYPLLINIEGEGSVNETVIEQGSSKDYNSGTLLELTAVPAAGWDFVEWSGDLIGTENPAQIAINGPKTVNATFECSIHYKSLFSGINTLTSHYQPMNIPFIDYADILNITLSKYGSNGIWTSAGNFNHNDMPDLVIATADWQHPASNEIAIMIDGEIAHTFNNPQTATRKISVADLNLDGIDDIVLFGTGPDIGNSPGDKIVVIYVYPDSYTIKEIGSHSGYFHTGVVGDVNNDGLPDIIGFDAQKFANLGGYAKVYLNNGASELWQIEDSNIPTHWFARGFHSELVDIDNDGILDLILGGHEWEEAWMSSSTETVQWRTHILKGVGNGQFDINNPVILPALYWWGIITDFDVYDIDQDNQLEIIITRTSGRDGLGQLPVDNEGYDGHRIQILKSAGNSWYEWKQIEQPAEIFTNADIHIEWPYATKIFDVNKDCLLDIVPESDKLNANSFAPLNGLRGLYYEQQNDGQFEIRYTH